MVIKITRLCYILSLVISLVISRDNDIQMFAVTLSIVNLLQLLYSRLFHGILFNTPIVQQIIEPVDHAEAPTWDARKNVLYYVNIHKGELYAYHYGTNKLNKVIFPGDVTPVVPSKRNPDLLIIGWNRSVVAVSWDGKSGNVRYKILATVSPQFPSSRFNDGKADKEGRLWFGTMGYENSSGVIPYQGVLYKITQRTRTAPKPIIYPVSISNGMAWNKANDKFYYIDTPTRQVREYNYDITGGLVQAWPRIVFDLKKNTQVTGFPDGMTIDKDDNLWIALYNGGTVIQVNPVTGKLLQTVAIPAQAVTSVAWGGPNYEILFVTTSRFRLNKTQRLMQPTAGSVFAVTRLGTRGLPAHHADLLDSIDEDINVSESYFGRLAVNTGYSTTGND